MKSAALFLFAVVALGSLDVLAQYCNRSVDVNISGNVSVYDAARMREAELKEKELELKRKQLELQRKREKNDWELQQKDRDEVLQQRALEEGGWKCANYFCGTRCQKKATKEGFCATHYREIQKGIKDSKYRMISNARYR